jgi:hypothetical protein
MTIIRYTHHSLQWFPGTLLIKLDQKRRDIAVEVLTTRKIQAGIRYILSGNRVRKCFIRIQPTDPEASANAFGFNDMSVSSTKRLEAVKPSDGSTIGARS